jgi:antitoxin component of MazEF toxin-antitoxin module
MTTSINRIERKDGILSLSLPAALAEQLHFQEGSVVTMTVRAGALVITPGQSPLENYPGVEVDLADLITPENRHDLIDWGSPRGREHW